MKSVEKRTTAVVQKSWLKSLYCQTFWFVDNVSNDVNNNVDTILILTMEIINKILITVPISQKKNRETALDISSVKKFDGWN